MSCLQMINTPTSLQFSPGGAFAPVFIVIAMFTVYNRTWGARTGLAEGHTGRESGL